VSAQTKIIHAIKYLFTAKIEEPAVGEPIPLPEDFNRYYDYRSFRRREYWEMETKILRGFNWEVKFPTVASFW